MPLRYTPFNSPDPHPLDGYCENDEQADCDFCNEKANLITPEGYPICTACAEERVDPNFNFSIRE